MEATLMVAVILVGAIILYAVSWKAFIWWEYRRSLCLECWRRARRMAEELEVTCDYSFSEDVNCRWCGARPPGKPPTLSQVLRRQQGE